MSDLDVARVDYLGYSALHYGVFHNNPAVCHLLSNLLRRFSISLDIPDRNHITPFLHACRLGHYACADAIQPCGPDLTPEEVREKIELLQGIQRAKERDFRSGRKGLTPPATETSTHGVNHTTRRPVRSGRTTTTTTVKERVKRPATSLCFPARTTEFDYNHGKPRVRSDSVLPPGGQTGWGSASQRTGCISAPARSCTAQASCTELSVQPQSSFIHVPEVATPKEAVPHPPHSPPGDSYRSYIPKLFSMYGDICTGSILPEAREGQPLLHVPVFSSRHNNEPDIISAIAATRLALRLKNKFMKGRVPTKSASHASQ